MKKILLASLLAFGLSAAFGAAFAAPDVPLYDGKTLTQDKLAVSNWGGGSVEDSTQFFLFGGHSLKVTTLNLYQGAKVSFLTPVALSGSSRMFQVTLKRGDVTLHYDPQTVPGAVPQAPQNTPGGFQGRRGGRRGGFGGQFGSPFGNQYGNRYRGRGGNAAPLIPLITKLHLEFTLADGRQADILQAIPETADPAAGAGWYSVNVPISSLKFGSGADSQLKSVTLAGDQYGVLFIGQMQIASETAASGKAAKAVPVETPDTTVDDANPPMDGEPGQIGPMDSETAPPMDGEPGVPPSNE